VSLLSDELALPAYDGTTSEEAAVLLNISGIPALKPISSHDMKEYLMTRGLWLDIKKSASVAAEMAIDSLNHFESFDINDAYVMAALHGVLGGLVAELTTPDFVESHKTEVLAMGDTTISRAEQLGIKVTAGLVQAERNP